MKAARGVVCALFAVTASLAIAGPAHAQTPVAAPAVSPSPVATAAGPSDPCLALSSLVSRPTFGTSPCAVKPNDALLETGYTNLSASGAGAGQTVTFPQANIRIGVLRNLEFDLDPPSEERLSAAPAVSGATDTSFGFKYEFGYTSRVVYAANVLYTANSGNAATSGNGDGVVANIDAALTLSPAVGLFSTVGYNTQSAGTLAMPAHYHGIDPSLGASVSLPASFSFALEGFGQSSSGPGLGGRYGFDAAVERDLGSRLQLDVNYFDYPGAPNGTHLHSIGFGAAYLIGS